MGRNGKVPQLKRKQAAGLFYLSLLMLAMFAFLFLGQPGYVLFDDSGSYMNITRNMEGVMPFYPLFLYGNQLLFGKDSYLYAVVIEQSFFAAACVILFIRMIKCRFCLRYWEAYICFLLALLPYTTDMPEAMTTQEILTEGIAYSVFYLFSAALLQTAWLKSRRWFGILCGLTLVMSSIRSQLQILFAVCGIICIYITVMGKKDGKKRTGLRILLGTAGCLAVCLAGIGVTAWMSREYQAFSKAMRTRQEQIAEETVKETTEAQEAEQDGRVRQQITTSQYISLIFSRGMYEADYEDYQLFEEEQLQKLYLSLYKKVDKAQYRYPYAETGLWMWKDIVGGIGSVGKLCFYEQNNFYQEEYSELTYDSSYSSVRNHNQLVIGMTLLKAHFGRFLYHTLMLLPQAFICTVFFQIERIYLLCHLITLFLYVSAVALMIFAYKSKKIDNAYWEMMCSVLGTNFILVLVISLIFFGQQRYLVYQFGIFYIAYFLILLQIWKQYGRDFVKKKWDIFRKREKN